MTTAENINHVNRLNYPNVVKKLMLEHEDLEEITFYYNDDDKVYDHNITKKGGFWIYPTLTKGEQEELSDYFNTIVQKIEKINPRNYSCNDYLEVTINIKTGHCDPNYHYQLEPEYDSEQLEEFNLLEDE